MEKNSKIFVAGHRGMVGSAIVRKLLELGFDNILTAPKASLDLKDQSSVRLFFQREKPDYVFLAAAKVGGIHANMTQQGDFLYENIAIQSNVIHEAWKAGTKKLVFLGSSCIYPRACPQPMKEEFILTGPLEPTNEGYAIAKLAGLKMCEFYHKQHGFNAVSVMPPNLYGPNDSFDLAHSHVLSALVRKFVDAQDQGLDSVEVWGTGAAMREFMHVDDMAAATIFAMLRYEEPTFINVGTGEEVSIKQLAEMIGRKVGFAGSISWNTEKPDGMPRKVMDSSRMKALGFSPSITLEQGVAQMIEVYKQWKTAGR